MVMPRVNLSHLLTLSSLKCWVEVSKAQQQMIQSETEQGKAISQVLRADITARDGCFEICEQNPQSPDWVHRCTVCRRMCQFVTPQTCAPDSSSRGHRHEEDMKRAILQNSIWNTLTLQQMTQNNTHSGWQERVHQYWDSVTTEKAGQHPQRGVHDKNRGCRRKSCRRSWRHQRKQSKVWVAFSQKKTKTDF